MTALFSNITLNAPRGPLDLSNRIVIAPMCQYSADEGRATDWHLMHWGNLLNGGAAMLILEATAVTARGRITPHCLGLWDDTTAAALQDTLHRARRLAPQVPVCIQLAHAGRKGSSARLGTAVSCSTPHRAVGGPKGPRPCRILRVKLRPRKSVRKV